MVHTSKMKINGITTVNILKDKDYNLANLYYPTS